MYDIPKPGEFVEKTDSCVTKEDLIALCTELIPDFGNDRYKIVARAVFDHEEGNGGYNRYENILLIDGVPTVVSLQRFAWNTTSDDREDYTTESIHRTYLLKDSPMARKIFSAIVKQKLHLFVG